MGEFVNGQAAGRRRVARGRRDHGPQRLAPHRDVQGMAGLMLRAGAQMAGQGISLAAASLFSAHRAAGARRAAAEPIADNSFLIEEAYNQEPGVVQHINTFAPGERRGTGPTRFTQEWPLVSEHVPAQLHRSGAARRRARHRRGRHRAQLPVPAPRWQNRQCTSRLARQRAPAHRQRGQRARGRGTSVQTNLPLSWAAALPPIAGCTANAGLTLAAGRRGQARFSAPAPIWLAAARGQFACVETAMDRGGDDGERRCSIPGVRWAFNFESGLQIVPGVAYTIGLDDGAGADGSSSTSASSTPSAASLRQ